MRTLNPRWVRNSQWDGFSEFSPGPRALAEPTALSVGSQLGRPSRPLGVRRGHRFQATERSAVEALSDSVVPRLELLERHNGSPGPVPERFVFAGPARFAPRGNLLRADRESTTTPRGCATSPGSPARRDPVSRRPGLRRNHRDRPTVVAGTTESSRDVP